MVLKFRTEAESGSYYDLIKSKQENKQNEKKKVSSEILHFSHLRTKMLHAEFSLSD